MERPNDIEGGDQVEDGNGTPWLVWSVACFDRSAIKGWYAVIFNPMGMVTVTPLDRLVHIPSSESTQGQVCGNAGEDQGL